MTDMETFARKVFSDQPFSRHIGAALTGVGAQWAEISLEIGDQHRQQHGFVHGGVVSYLADNAITFAGGLALGGNALTSEYKINYLRPALGERLVARAETVSVGKRQAVCQCQVRAVTDEGEKTCAIAQGTVLPAG